MKHTMSQINTVSYVVKQTGATKRLRYWGPSEWCYGKIEWWSQYFIKAGVQWLMRAQNTFVESTCANLGYIYLKEHALIVLLVMLVSGIVRMVM